MYGIARWQGSTKSSFAEWRTAFVVGGCLLLFGNGSVTIAEQWVASGLASLLVATVPIYIALLAWLSGSAPRPRTARHAWTCRRICRGRNSGWSGPDRSSRRRRKARWPRDAGSAPRLVRLVDRFALFAPRPHLGVAFSFLRANHALRWRPHDHRRSNERRSARSSIWTR